MAAATSATSLIWRMMVPRIPAHFRELVAQGTRSPSTLREMERNGELEPIPEISVTTQ
jgi:hypothetical protein